MRAFGVSQSRDGVAFESASRFLVERILIELFYMRTFPRQQVCCLSLPVAQPANLVCACCRRPACACACHVRMCIRGSRTGLTHARVARENFLCNPYIQARLVRYP